MASELGGTGETTSASKQVKRPLDRATAFCAKYGLKLPIMLAPMAGACPASLSIAVANAGGMGAMGALLSPADGIRSWVQEFRANGLGSFQLNVWIPDPKPVRDPAVEELVRKFLEEWGPAVPASAGNVILPDFNSQCEAFLEMTPTAVSSIMGVFSAGFVKRLKENGIAWFATATTLAEAKMARDAGADAIIAQGYEAGGHRGSFDQAAAELKPLASLSWRGLSGDGHPLVSTEAGPVSETTTPGMQALEP